MRTTPFVLAAALAGVFVLSEFGRAANPKFFDDDPIASDPERQDASRVQAIKSSEGFDFIENSFLKPGDSSTVRAVNVNTIDEVPDSSWFTNRAGTAQWSPDHAAKGPDSGTGPAPGPWTIIEPKTEGVTPGMTIRDSAGVVYFVKFDPPSNPEMASGAEVVSTKFFHAFGYNVPENYVALVARESLTIAPGTQIPDQDGRLHPMRPADIDALLQRAARSADGRYRALASKALVGRPVGNFRFYGTRPDDPNDIHPHEHRRELRGLVVFSAWLNHDDSRSINTLDTLVADGTRSIVRHHLIDFGSTLGSGSTQAQSTRAGNEFIWDSRPTLITMLTLGLYVRPWVKFEYPDYPSIGRFEGNYFLPEAWKPEYRNPAFANARPDDRFWAARILAAVPDETVRRVVETARYSDPRAADYLIETLLLRKTKVLSAWLNGTNPIVNPALSNAGVLTFENAAERAGVASAAERYTVEWLQFDNASGAHEPAGPEATITEPRAQAPGTLLDAKPQFVAARIRGFHPDRPAWAQPVMLYFRQVDGRWKLVGLERHP
jgi:hypothetical protein